MIAGWRRIFAPPPHYFCVRDPLVLPAAAVVAGIFANRMLGMSVAESAWPVAAFLLLSALARGTRSAVPRAGITLAFFFAGALTETLHRPGPPPEIDAGPRETMILEGCVVDPPVFSENREQFTIELAPKARARVTLSTAEPQRLAYGQRIEIDARIRKPRTYRNPGSFDYAQYLARQNIYWTAAMTSNSRARILEGRCGSRLLSAVFALRTAALDRIERLYGEDTYSAAMMEAILIGESSKLRKIWTEDFRRTGTFHALVISGVHVSVLAMVLMFFLRRLFVPEIPALAITSAAAWLYALVSGLSAPVVRAAGGFTLYLIARFFFRRGRVMNLLAAVALVYLLFDPAEMFDASFQLSFLCVAAIGSLAAPLLEATSAPLTRAMRDPGNADLDTHLAPRAAQFRVELRLAAETIALWTKISFRWALTALALGTQAALFAFEVALISTVIQIGLALPMAVYFHRVSFTGLTANILIVPLLNGVVPVGFAAIFTGSRTLAAVAAFLLKIAARIAAWHAAIEPDWRVPDPPLWLAIAFTASLVAIAAWHKLQPVKWLAVVAAFVLLLRHPFTPHIEANTLELTAIDVGQGDSLLVVFPRGKTMLVDGGGLLQYGRQRKTNFDTGEDVVSPYLWHRGIRHLDVIVVTHPHEDHAGGIASLIRNFQPAEIWTGSNPLARIPHPVEKHKSDPFPFDGATIEILSPPPDYASKKPGNNDSLAMRISYGQRSFLLTGDIEIPMESRLIDARVRADVLKVAHHGSRTSTMQPFLDAVAPSFALISVGSQNTFGHPTREVLDRLSARRTETFRTDVDGLITIRTDGRRLSVDTAAWHPGATGWLDW